MSERLGEVLTQGQQFFLSKSPVSIAVSSILELRHAMTMLGIDEAHELIDRIEALLTPIQHNQTRI